VLEAGGPLSLDEIAAPEAAGAPATTRSRCKPSVAPKGIARPGAARARSPRLLEILFDPRHPEFEEMRTWAGAFEPERFDLGRVNAALAAVPAY
jgi:hypothetical protein